MSPVEEPRRPSPESLLRLAREEERRGQLGRLKLFFGMCPGVGKTYAMLEAARQRRVEGVDAVVGLVETHGRAETEALLEGLEVLPRRRVPYREIELAEFDIDAALARRPRLLLVDELAHTNVPGSRHAKRWQDVEELLDAGIDVYTTLNVQHWESLNDVVAQITGRKVRETVPDTFLTRADDLELVDLSPEDLLQRLKDGKVYRGEAADRAADGFFQPGTLIALRELALRHAAEHVDAQMRAFKEQHEIAGVWPVGERLLVGVSSGPMAARLIRATARLAGRLRASWIALYVETPAELQRRAADRARVVENLRLAERLGAETVTRSGQGVTEELIALARERNVTKIVLGKPARPRWKELLQGSVLNDVARRCGDIDLYVISGFGAELAARRPPSARRPSSRSGAAVGVAGVAAVTLLCWPLARVLDRANLVMLYLVPVTWVAYRHDRVAALVASALGVLAYDFFFVPPYLSFAVSDAQYLLTFAVMLGVGLLVTVVAQRLRGQNEQMRRREERLRTLYRLSRELAETPDPVRLLRTAQRRLEEFLATPVALITRAGGALLQIAAGDPARFHFDEDERAVATWALDHGAMAGAGTDTLSGARALYVPLKGVQTTVGVLGIVPEAGHPPRDPEHLRLLETFATVVGGALESTRMSAAAGRAQMMLEMQVVEAPSPGAAVRLGDTLEERRILYFHTGTPPEQILRDLVGALRLPNPGTALQAIVERERTGTTVIGSGVSVPHARLAGLDGIHAALGIAAEGPTRVWLLFLGPDERPEEHLAFLAAVARYFRCPGSVERLLVADSPAAALRTIRREEGGA